jgi:hypothetical protein
MGGGSNPNHACRGSAAGAVGDDALLKGHAHRDGLLAAADSFVLPHGRGKTTWYENVFEAKVVYRNPAMAFLTYDEEHHRMTFANLDVLKPGGKGPNDRGEIGVNHVAYTYAHSGDLLETLCAFEESGDPSSLADP